MKYWEPFLKGLVAGAFATGKFVAMILILIAIMRFAGGGVEESPKLVDATVADLMRPIFMMAIFLGIWLKD